MCLAREAGHDDREGTAGRQPATPWEPRAAGMSINDRAHALFTDAHRAVCTGADRLFISLLLIEWLAEALVAWRVTPGTWLGSPAAAGGYVVPALVMGGVCIWPAIIIALRHPGSARSRIAIATAQALTSAFLIHLSGGRIETHFHVFGSLAFLSLYRDWRPLVIASSVIALDHVVRGTFFPQSVFGHHHVETWRWLEHTAWVLFTDVFLVAAGRQSLKEMRRLAAREALIEHERDAFEQRVTERTASLALSEARFRQLSEASPVGVFHADASGRLLYVNGAWQRLFGPASGACRHWIDVLHPDDRADVHRRWDLAVARACGIPEIVCRFGAPDGADRWAAIRAELVTDPASPLQGYVGILADITEAKQAAIALDAARAAAESANAVKSEFLAHMSHEMRTPLNGILGMTTLALDGELPDDQRDCLQTVQSSAQALLILVNDVLDFSRLEAMRLELRPQPFALRATFERALKPLALRAAQAGLVLEHAIDPAAPDMVSGDRDRLRQVLLNLVTNAIKFTEHGRIDVAVTVDGSEGDDILLGVTVVDTGIGIPPERHAQIFAPFEQVDGSLTRQHDGVGLGLAIAARLVALMGGAISVRSAPGAGSAFRFTARLTRATPIETPPPLVTPRAAGGGLRVLVAEDNPINRLIATRMLAKLGHAVVSVENGRRAFEQVFQEPFDLVLMDVQMPEMDGLAAAAAIRTHERQHDGHVPIVAVTAHALARDREICAEAGMDAFLTKPLAIEALAAAIEQVTSTQRRLPETCSGDSVGSARQSLLQLPAEDMHARVA
jgi:two-component system, sensor histidine kinase and response regulator